MKKIFTLLFCAVMFCTLNAQGLYQMEDPGFEGTWEGDEPIGWNSFSTANASELSSTIRNMAKSQSPKPSKVEGYYSNSAVQIYSKYAGIDLGWLGKYGANANGNITTGIINMGDSEPTSSKNYNYTATNNDDFNMPFAGRPDAVVFYAKFTSGGSPNGSATFILHDEVNFRDPEISSQTGNRVGRAQVNIPASSDWTYYKAEFAYDRETPAKQYLLASITTNPTPGGTKDDYLVFDDVYFLYYSTLSAISYEGVNVNFKEDTYYYDLSSVEYSADKFSCTKKGVGATVSESFDEELQKMTITVRGNDYSVDSSNETVYTVQFKKEEAAPVYTAIASSNNALFGNAKVEGSDNVFTFTATAAEGYIFTNWTSNGVVVSTENPYTVTATADLNLVANFVALPPVYTANVSSNNAQFGSAKVEKVGDNVFTFTATAAEGYEFVNWTSNGEEVSVENPYTVTATENLNLVANFVALPPVYTATATANNAQFGSANVEKSGDNVFTFTATAAEGYKFVNWTLSNGKIVSAENPYTLTAVANVELVANFVALPPVYTATATSNNAQFGSAKVEKSGDNVFTFTATPVDGYLFVSWTNDGKLVSAENPYTVTATENLNLVANFVAPVAPPTYTVTAEAQDPTMGTATVEVVDGVATFKAVPNEGYKFVDWLLDGEYTGLGAEFVIEVSQNIALVAVFEAIAVEPEPTTEYAHHEGTNRHAGRALTTFTIANLDTEATLTVSDIQVVNAKSPIYVDKTDNVFEVKPGNTIYFEQFGFAGEWMHAYAYIDYNNDFVFGTELNIDGDTEGELVSHNFYSATDAEWGTTSRGQEVKNGNANNTNSYEGSQGLPHFTLPADLAAGDYRMRIKTDWNNLDPNFVGHTQQNNPENIGACQVDIILRVAAAVEPEPEVPSYTATVDVNDAAMGSAIVTLEGSVATFTATANEGYKFAGWLMDGYDTGNVTNPLVFDIAEMGVTSLALVAKFEVLPPVEKEYLAFVSATPEDNSTVGSLSYVILAFDPDAYVYNNVASVDVKDANGNVVTTATFGWMIPEVGACKGNELVLTLTAAISEAGTYTITLPENAVWDYSNGTEEMTLTFTVDPSLLQTGVNGVDVEGAKVIYDVTGRRIVEITRPGIYIVDGVKVLVK